MQSLSPGVAPLLLLQSNSTQRLAALSCLLLCSGALMGCRGRARDDIYIETMAAEIRDLEDQCYEYDYEYRRLEQEYADMRRRLSTAEARLENASANSQNNGGPPSILSRASEAPTPSFSPPSSSAPTNENAVDTLPTPPAGTGGSGSQPARPSDPGDGFNDMGDVPIDDLQPPTIEFGSPAAPPVSVLQNPHSSVAPEDDLELNLARVEIPALTASHPSIPSDPLSLNLQNSALGASAPSRLIEARPKVTDRRIVELAFHPVLSRSIDLDGRTGDDGVFLVIQPKNQLGQLIVPDTSSAEEYARLTVVVLDPALPEERARIGFREYSPAEVRAKMTPLGAQAGIHLQLPWNGPDPIADRVIVFAKFTFSNEQEVIGSREIMLTADAQLKTVWTPRQPASPGRSDVEQERFAGLRQSQSSEPFAQGLQSQQPRPGSSVVRPAAGTSPSSPAPVPGQGVTTASGNSWNR